MEEIGKTAILGRKIRDHGVFLVIPLITILYGLLANKRSWFVRDHNFTVYDSMDQFPTVALLGGSIFFVFWLSWALLFLIRDTKQRTDLPESGALIKTFLILLLFLSVFVFITIYEAFTDHTISSDDNLLSEIIGAIWFTPIACFAIVVSLCEAAFSYPLMFLAAGLFCVLILWNWLNLDRKQKIVRVCMLVMPFIIYPIGFEFKNSFHNTNRFLKTLSLEDRHAWATKEFDGYYPDLVTFASNAPIILADIGRLKGFAPVPDEKNYVSLRGRIRQRIRFTLEVIGSRGKGLLEIECMLYRDKNNQKSICDPFWRFGSHARPLPTETIIRGSVSAEIQKAEVFDDEEDKRFHEIHRWKGD